MNHNGKGVSDENYFDLLFLAISISFSIIGRGENENKNSKNFQDGDRAPTRQS